MEMIDRKTWKDFQDAGLLWWVNRMLHLFGWAIVLQVEANGQISDIYPARCKFRGFHQEYESEGFTKLTKHISQTMPELLEEVPNLINKDISDKGNQP